MGATLVRGGAHVNRLCTSRRRNPDPCIRFATDCPEVYGILHKNDGHETIRWGSWEIWCLDNRHCPHLGLSQIPRATKCGGFSVLDETMPNMHWRWAMPWTA